MRVHEITPRSPGKPQLVLLLAASCLSVLGAILVAPVLPLMGQYFGATPGAAVLVPIVLTVPALVIGLTAGVAGVVVDRLGRTRILLVALVAYAIFGTAPLYLDSLGAIIATRVGVGLCEAVIMTACTTLIADYWTGEKRARYLGLQATFAAISAVVFVAIGGALGAAGWRTPFWIYLVSLLLVVPMARLIWSPAPEKAASVERVPVPWRALAGPVGVTLLGGIVFYALIVELSFVLTEVGITATGTIGAVVAAMSIATAVGGAVFGRLSRLGRRVLLPVEFGLSGLGLLIVFSGSGLPVIAIGSLITGFATGLMLPTLLTWAVEGLEYAQRGRGTGIWTGSLFIGEFICPLVIAAITIPAGGLQPALAVLGVVSIVIGVGLRFVLRKSATAVPDAAPAV